MRRVHGDEFGQHDSLPRISAVVEAIRHCLGGEAGLKTLKEQVRSFEARVITQALERNQANCHGRQRAWYQPPRVAL